MPGPMLPITLLSLFGPQLLGRLFGGGGNEEVLRRRIAELLSPSAIGARTNALQNEWYKSPAYTNAQTTSLAAGNQAQAEVGRAGQGVTSGLDILKSGASVGVGPAILNQLAARQYEANQTLAQRGAEMDVNALMGIGPNPNFGRELFGSSLNFLGPLVGQYLKGRYGWS
jgi:hypothetical protein